MKVKKEYIVLGLLIVLLSAYLALRGRDRTSYRLPLLAKISADKIDRIDIKGPDGRVELKKDQIWQLMPQAYPADGDAVQKMLEDIGGLSLTALVAESKNYQRYDLGKQNKIRIQAWSSDNKLLREFEVGKAAPSFSHTFVKIGGDGRVFHASGNLRDQFGKKPEDLRNKTVLSFERKQIQEIQITKERQTTVFKRQPASAQDQQDQATPKKQVSSKDQQPVWMADKGDRVDVARIERFLATLDKLTCDGYLEGHKKSEFLEPVFEVRLKDPKTVYRLALFAPLDKKKEAHPGVSTQNDFVFFLEKWQADKVMLSPGELMEKAAAVEKQIP